MNQPSMAMSPIAARSQPLKAASAALTTSDTSSRKPSDRIIATDSSRVRTTPQTPRFGFGSPSRPC